MSSPLFRDCLPLTGRLVGVLATGDPARIIGAVPTLGAVPPPCCGEFSLACATLSRNQVGPRIHFEVGACYGTNSSDDPLPRLWSLRLLPRERSPQFPLALRHASPHLLWPALPSPEHSRYFDSRISDAHRIHCLAPPRLGRRRLLLLSRGDQRHSRHGSRSSRRGNLATLGRELRRPHARDSLHLRSDFLELQ